MGEGPADQLAIRASSRLTKARWNDCKILVIDEVSMISGTFFDKIEEVARRIRGNDEPFGGIQLVLSGDFLQLPPVKALKPAFRANSWDHCIKRKIVLTRVFRQQGDPVFINLLNNLRIGQMTLKDEAMLKKSHYNKLPDQHGVIATKLNSLKLDTQAENELELNKLPSEAIYFRAYDSGRSQSHLELLKKDCPAREIVKLKQGAQVMLLRNYMSEDLCNGSRGIVIDFVRVNGSDQAGAGQDKTFICSTSYEPSVENLNFSGQATDDDTCLLPRVQFDNGVIKVIESDRWDILVRGEVQASRRQIPLTLAWSLTIHKSQGMTLDRAEINAHGIFENGQLYVAVSRVKSMQGLKLLSFTRKTMRTDYTVVEWYKQLEAETAKSTAELLQEVETFFPQLEKDLEAERKQSLDDEAEEKRQKEIERAGPFAQIEPPVASSSAAAVEESDRLIMNAPSHFKDVLQPSIASPPSKPVKPEPSSVKPFRSPLKNASLAAIATAEALAMQTSRDQFVIKQEASSKETQISPLPALSSSSESQSQSQSLSQSSFLSQSKLNVNSCCICKDEHPTVAIFDCMHLCLCEGCSTQFRPSEEEANAETRQRCPVCQTPIKKVQKMFYA